MEQHCSFITLCITNLGLGFWIEEEVNDKLNLGSFNGNGKDGGGGDKKKQQAEQGGDGVVKRKPVFLKVSELKPGTTGNTLSVKVLSSTTVLDKKSRNTLSFNSRSGAPHTLMAECLIGDETGTILFTARNAQVELMKPGRTVIICNAKIDMFKGSMRLAVDKWGRIDVTNPATFTVKEDNNMSLVEYELVNVVEE